MSAQIHSNPAISGRTFPRPLATRQAGRMVPDLIQLELFLKQAQTKGRCQTEEILGGTICARNAKSVSNSQASRSGPSEAI
jgi:hypothetical protein